MFQNFHMQKQNVNKKISETDQVTCQCKRPNSLIDQDKLKDLYVSKIGFFCEVQCVPKTYFYLIMYSFSEMNRVGFDKFSLFTEFVRSATKGKYSVAMLHETQKMRSKNFVPK